jgi:hypothetical protein
MAEPVSMASTAITVLVGRASPDLTANTRSTSVIRLLAKMEQHASNTTTNMNATALTASKESNAKSSSTGALNDLVKTVLLAFNKRTNSDAIVHQDGLAKCAMSKWFRAGMQRFARKLI